jgi:hypothetical protein
MSNKSSAVEKKNKYFYEFAKSKCQEEIQDLKGGGRIGKIEFKPVSANYQSIGNDYYNYFF